MKNFLNRFLKQLSEGLVAFIIIILGFCCIGATGVILSSTSQLMTMTWGTDTSDTPAVAGALFVDTDHYLMGMSDGTNRVVLGRKSVIFCQIILNPDLVEEDTDLTIWSNFTGCTYEITSVYAKSDVTGSQVDLFYLPDMDNHTTGRTAIDSDVTDSAGTGCFYNLTSSLDSSTVVDGGAITWDQDAAQIDAKYLQVVLIGEYRAP